MNKLVFFAVLLVAGLLLFGCTNSPLDAAKSSPIIQTFLADYPDAEINVQLLTASNIQDALSDHELFLSNACPNMEPASYYYVKVADVNSGLNAFAFIDESGKVICAFKAGKSSLGNGSDLNAGTDLNAEVNLPTDNNGLISILSPDDNTEVINEPTEPATVVTGSGNIEQQFQDIVCNTLPPVAVRLPSDMLMPAVPFPIELDSALFSLGIAITYDSRAYLQTVKGHRYAVCFGKSNIYSYGQPRTCDVTFTANLPSGTETGAIQLTFSGEVLPFCSGCPPGAHYPVATSDSPVDRSVNPCVANTQAYPETVNVSLEPVNATYDTGTNVTYDTGGTNTVTSASSSDYYDAAITGMNGSTQCQYRDYEKPAVIFNRTGCSVHFDHPESCPEKSGQVLCGQCPYSSDNIALRGECYYCPSGSRCNWGVAGICGGAACISGGSNTVGGTYFTSCGTCQEGGLSYYSCRITCNEYYNLCIENVCRDITTNCQ
ncbi:MAG: hypothetical protein NTY48_02165 [Candidatus Diapherotrites archaeon]|nr:hypothetical protein [Candidatus Diapherotrites archaeon]